MKPVINKKSKVKTRFGTPAVLRSLESPSENLVREREVLKIKDEETQKAWHRVKYWGPIRMLERLDKDKAQKYGRKWYEDIKLCLEGVSSFKFTDYYNVVIVLCDYGYCTQDEAWELFDIANKRIKKNK